MKGCNIARWDELVKEFYDNQKVQELKTWNEEKNKKVKRENYTFDS